MFSIHFPTLSPYFYIRLFYTHSVARVNTLSTLELRYLGFGILATSQVISVWETICALMATCMDDQMPLGDQAAGTMTRFPTQSLYPDTVLSSHFPYRSNAERQAN